VLVQGAASGLGLNITKLYASRGCKMVLTDRNEAGLKTVVKDLNDNLGNFNVHYIAGDATSEDDCKKVVEFTIRQFGRIDIAVLCVGLGAHQTFDENTDLSTFRKLIDVNLFGYVNLTKYLLPHLKLTRGQMVVISSVSGVAPMPHRQAYCSSKYAVTGFFDSLRMDVGDKVAITMCNPSTFTGSNFRQNGIGRGDAPPSIKGDKSLTVEQCAEVCVAAADRRVRSVVMPGKVYFVSALHPMMPTWVEPIIKRGAKL
jgi:short-subunit dehydrogenase